MSDQPPVFVLRFISGEVPGGEFPLRQNREIIIGRSSDLDMVLVEDMVSRKHTKITTTDSEVFIQDLGSTNGTFVNGEKVSRSRLQEGDRVLVGTSIIKMVAVDPSQYHQAASEAEARKRLEAGAARQQTQGRPMSGAIEEIPLPDLLQLLSTSRKSGVLSVASDRGVGRIYLRTGQIYFVAINDDFNVSPIKAINRMLSWTTGTFDLAAGEIQGMEELKDSTEGLLMDGIRQLDEFANLGPKMPSIDAALAVPTPLAGKLRDLPPALLDVFQLVLDHGQVQAVLDNFSGTDLEAAKHLMDLMGREFVVVP